MHAKSMGNGSSCLHKRRKVAGSGAGLRVGGSRSAVRGSVL
jgi:hypothetical protein